MLKTEYVLGLNYSQFYFFNTGFSFLWVIVLHVSFFASPIALLITSSIVMSYIFTNHLLNPLSKKSDPFVSTTSLVVYRIFDRLHLNFSYHTEHHLFPGMNSDYYPILSNLLTELYGDRYRRIDFGDAWNRLWKIQIYAADVKFPTRFAWNSSSGGGQDRKLYSSSLIYALSSRSQIELGRGRMITSRASSTISRRSTIIVVSRALAAAAKGRFNWHAWFPAPQLKQPLLLH